MEPFYLPLGNPSPSRLRLQDARSDIMENEEARFFNEISDKSLFQTA